jgi:hypothetical protein
MLYSKKLAAIIGGAAGGGGLVIILAVLYYWQRSRQCQPHHTKVDPEPMKSSLQQTAFAMNPPHLVDTLHDWSPSSLLPEDTRSQNTNISPSLTSPKSIISSVTSTHALTSLMAAPSTIQSSSPNHSPRLAEAATVTHVFANPGSMGAGTSPPTNARLTDEQSELVQGLIRHDIPLLTVAGVMKGMIKKPGPLVGSEGSGNQEVENPPNYDVI